MLENKEKYPTYQSIADALDCTRTIVISVVKGKRVDSPKLENCQYDPNEMCESCGIRPKGQNLRFLCQYCFTKKGYLNDYEDCSPRLRGKSRQQTSEE
jgi:hypothetical protein